MNTKSLTLVALKRVLKPSAVVLLHRCFRLKNSHNRVLGLALILIVFLSTGLTAGDTVPNPYRNAQVGDWVKYKATSRSSILTFGYEYTNTVTEIVGNTLTITQDVTFDDGKKKQFKKQVDRSRPLELFTWLGYDRPHNLKTVKVRTQTKSLTVAGETFETRSEHYDIGSKSLYPAEKRIWYSPKIPLAGIVKLQTTSKGSASSVTTETLVSFGRAGSNEHSKPEPLAQSTQPPVTLTNSLGMKLCKIPSGDFLMGTLELTEFHRRATKLRSTEEKMELLQGTPPQRAMAVADDFWIGAHEVTVKQFREFIKQSGYKTDARRSGRGGTGLLPSGKFGPSRQFDWNNYGFEMNDSLPVVNVSWNDAVAFCKWLSKTENKNYRLPTEVEWEYACRAGTTTRFYSGDTIADLEGVANVADRSLARQFAKLPWPAPFDDETKYLANVGQFHPNKFGLYDMHGNALEWCSPRYSVFDPLEDFDPPKSGNVLYVVRGGNWFNEPFRCGSASRSGAPPTQSMSLIGFRVVLDEGKGD